MIDSKTFGDNKADITLAEILTEINNPGLTAKVTKILATGSKRWKSIEFKDDTTRVFLYPILKESVVKLIDQSIREENVKTFVKNCAITRLRRYILGIKR
jgi:hypothetical protein